MFLDNKYTNWYYHIITKIQSENRKRYKKSDSRWVYYEQHHIIPKCFDGLDIAENLVLLTAREHFVVHWLLTKMVGSTRQKEQMLNALGKMMQSNSGDRKKIITGRRYEICRKAYSKRNSTFMSRLHKGKTGWNTGLTKETDPRIKGPKVSEEHKEKLRKLKTGVPRSEELKQKLREYNLKHPPVGMGGKTHTEETKIKMKANHRGMTGRKNPAPSKECKHCGVIMDARNIGRYHNEKCKILIIN